MARCSFAGLADGALLRELASLVVQDRATTAALLACLAEVDARRLFAPAGYPSMFAYCLGELHMSEDTAFKRIRAARAARDFPAILPALADGRVGLSAVLLLTPHLTAVNAAGLLAAATHRTNAEIERLLAERFPRPDLPEQLRPMAQTATAPAQTVRPAGERSVVPDGTERTSLLALVAGPECLTTPELAVRPVGIVVSQQAALPCEPPRARVAPLAPGRFALQVTLSQHAHDQLRYAQALLGHALPSGDLSQVLERALDTLVAQLERSKFAAAARTGPRRTSSRPHYIPAAVRREVWWRDEGRCTFVSDSGKRCEATNRLEYDHVEPVARGGDSRPSQLRLRCRAHNHLEAERVFGTEFMMQKRRQARERVQERPGAARHAAGPIPGVAEAAGTRDS